MKGNKPVLSLHLRANAFKYAMQLWWKGQMSKSSPFSSKKLAHHVDLISQTIT